MNIQVSDIVQFVHRTQNCTKIIKLFYKFSTKQETLKTVKDIINSANNSTYKNLRHDGAQKSNRSETQVYPKVMNKFIIIGKFFFVSACAQTKSTLINTFHFLTATCFVYFDRISSLVEMSSP